MRRRDRRAPESRWSKAAAATTRSSAAGDERPRFPRNRAAPDRQPDLRRRAGNDIVYGERGNDTLRGNGGNDRLYGGIGDDVLEGGEGDDLLSGGFGADEIDGEAGNDYVRGDATTTSIVDTGGDVDTLELATASRLASPPNSPTGGAGLSRTRPANAGYSAETRPGRCNAVDGRTVMAGRTTKSPLGAFEQFIGTPFFDYIVGSKPEQEILWRWRG